MSSYLIERESLGEREGPALLERSSDHSAAGGRSGTRQTERVLEVQTTHLDGEVNVVDWCVEQRQTSCVVWCDAG